VTAGACIYPGAARLIDTRRPEACQPRRFLHARAGKLAE
jgi:hypothetical protein